MVDFATPASLSHKPSVEKISRIGTPAEKPKNNIVTTLGWKNNRKLSSIESNEYQLKTHQDLFVNAHKLSSASFVLTYSFFNYSNIFTNLNMIKQFDHIFIMHANTPF